MWGECLWRHTTVVPWLGSRYTPSFNNGFHLEEYSLCVFPVAEAQPKRIQLMINWQVTYIYFDVHFQILVLGWQSVHWSCLPRCLCNWRLLASSLGSLSTCLWMQQPNIYTFIMFDTLNRIVCWDAIQISDVGLTLGHSRIGQSISGRAPQVTSNYSVCNFICRDKHTVTFYYFINVHGLSCQFWSICAGVTRVERWTS